MDRSCFCRCRNCARCGFGHRRQRCRCAPWPRLRLCCHPSRCSLCYRRSCCHPCCRFSTRWHRSECCGGASSRRLRRGSVGAARRLRAARQAWPWRWLARCTACACARAVCRPSPNRRTSRGRVRAACRRRCCRTPCRMPRARCESWTRRASAHASRAPPLARRQRGRRKLRPRRQVATLKAGESVTTQTSQDRPPSLHFFRSKIFCNSATLLIN